ncbi:hypothetical protein LTR95_000602 [Oleoguttula sp. CCFEE 5521]
MDTMSSSFGILPRMAAHSTLSFSQPGFPNVRFERADTLVKLCDDPKHWLLVHSSVVAGASTHFKTTLTGIWANGSITDKLVHPATGAIREVKVLELRAFEDTYFLEGKHTLGGRLARKREGGWNKAVPMISSSMAAPGTPSFNNYRRAMDLTVTALHILFALIYGVELTHDGVFRFGKNEDQIHGHINRHFMCLIVTVVAYAEYCGCIPAISDGVCKILVGLPNYWVAGGFEPMNHAMLAVKLQSEEIFFDAMRHFIPQAHLDHTVGQIGYHQAATWTDVAEVLGCEVEDAMALYKEELHDQAHSIRELTAGLHRLALNDAQVFHGCWHTRKTTVMQVIDFASQKITGSKKHDLATNFIVGGIYGQWLVNQLHGVTLSKDGYKVRAKDVGRLNIAVERLQRAHRWAQPANLFGLRTPNRIVSFFTGQRENEIKQKLEHTFHLANGTINASLNNDTAIRDPHGFHGTSKYNFHPLGYFANIKVDHKLPWDAECTFDNCDVHGRDSSEEEARLRALEWNITQDEFSDVCERIRQGAEDGEKHKGVAGVDGDATAESMEAKISVAPVSEALWAALLAANPIVAIGEEEVGAAKDVEEDSGKSLTTLCLARRLK